MLRTLIDLYFSRNNRQQTCQDEKNSTVEIPRKNGHISKTVHHETQNDYSVDDEIIMVDAKIIKAETVDKKINEYFTIRTRNDEEYSQYFADIKWNAIANDRVKLKAKLDAKGSLEILEMMPKKKKDFEYGRVTSCEPTYAIFEQKIILLFEAIQKYPVLKMYDEYKFEAIESDQKIGVRNFDFRVMNLISKVEKTSNGSGIEFKCKIFKIFVENVKDDFDTTRSQLITVCNKSCKAVDLISIKATAENANDAHLVHFDKADKSINYNLSAKSGQFIVHFKVRPAKIGKFYFCLTCTFSSSTQKTCGINDFEETHRFFIEISKSVPIPGKQFRKSPRFVDVRISSYDIPEKMREIDFNKIHTAKDELIKIYSCLGEDLNAVNYLEKIAIEKSFCSYRIEKGVFETKNDYLKLIVKDVAEKRPSIIVGDTITAADPYQSDDERPIFIGCIHKVENDSILCKFHDDFHKTHNEKEFTIEFKYSRSIFRRQQYAIEQMLMPHCLGVDFLFPDKKISANQAQIDASLSCDGALRIGKVSHNWFNIQLNTNQKNAVVNVMRGENRPLPYIYFGCPGSGKTQTICEAILQIYTHVKSSNIIIATPSNSAANLITEMLINSNVFNLVEPPFLRIVGNNQVERDLIPDSVIKYSATICIKSDNGRNKVEIKKNSRGMMQDCTKSKIKEYRIVIGTLNCLGTLMLMKLQTYYTHVFIDEAGQSIEPETTIPLTLMAKNGQCVLAGDINQLGPILVSRAGKMLNFNSSLLERFLKTQHFYAQTFGLEGNEYDKNFVTKLNTNYRSLPSVLKPFNELFYNNQLQPAVDEYRSIEARFLGSLDDVLWKNTNLNHKIGVYFVNVANGKNRKIPESCSFYNEEEIRGIISFLSKCSSNKIDFKKIGCVTPYALQVKMLKTRIGEKLNDTDLKIGTVEEFQGQERMIVLVSTVRTDERHLSKDSRYGLGFLDCPRRMNVAISRARALLVVFGKESILAKDSSWKHLIDYTKDNNTFINESY